MGQSHTLAFTVETYSTFRHGAHRLADFARLQPAIRAAKESLSDPRVTLAVVKDRAGTLVYACDNRKQWSQPPDSLHDSAETDVSGSAGTRPPEPDEPDITAYRRHGIALLLLYALAAWIEVSPL